MSTAKPKVAALPGRTTIEELPGRVLTFLRAAGTSSIIRATLSAHGYTDADHDDGWRLLQRASGYAPTRASFGPEVELGASAAVSALTAWCAPHFAMASATLARRFPAQGEFVFAGLASARGAAAVLHVAVFLDRLDALAAGAARPDTHIEDQAALALLGTRGIDQAERDRLRALVAQAQKVPSESATPPANDSDTPEARAAHEAALSQLYLWYKEWAAIARAVFARRDHLIRLGLAYRKRGAG